MLLLQVKTFNLTFAKDHNLNLMTFVLCAIKKIKS
jgi:hypothetical protein